ncbi:hypothetical protein [Georgenia yuyongxinii]
MAKPTYASPTPANADIAAAHQGASMLGLPLTPQGERVARLLEARKGEGVRYRTAVVEMPRRAAKTTSIMSTLIGRAVSRPGYRCVVTAQSGTIASSIILEHGQMLEANGFAGFDPRRADKVNADLGDGTMRLLRNGGREKIEFANGSRIWCVPPEAGAVRSAAADDIFIDEAGEHEGAKGVDFLNAVRPLQDTRGPLAQLIVAGTPGRSRDGMFWDLLVAGRKKTKRNLGILDYCARDDEDPDDPKVWRRVHPGPSAKLANGRPLTPMSVIRERREDMDLVSFAREYLCAWPSNASTGALDTDAWRRQGLDDLPERPARSVIAIDAPKEQTCCAVLEVWRNDEGKACIEVLAFRPGVSWAAAFAHKAAREAKAPVVFDEIGGNVTIAAELRRKRPGVQVVPLKMREVGGAAQLLATEIREGRVEHYGQPDLTSSVEAASWRPMGRDGRAFGHRPGYGEISPVVAASFALWHYDQIGDRKSFRIRTSNTPAT